MLRCFDSNDVSARHYGQRYRCSQFFAWKSYTTTTWLCGSCESQSRGIFLLLCLTKLSMIYSMESQILVHYSFLVEFLFIAELHHRTNYYVLILFAEMFVELYCFQWILGVVIHLKSFAWSLSSWISMVFIFHMSGRWWMILPMKWFADDLICNKQMYQDWHDINISVLLMWREDQRNWSGVGSRHVIDDL